MKILFLLTFVSLTAGYVALINAMEQETSLLCDIADLDSNKAWAQCLDEPVKIRGTHTRPEQIMQHPVMVMQTPQLDGPGESSPQQDYLNVAGRQIILLVQDDITCEDEVEVTGTLKQIDLGGKKGTKNEYKNWLIDVSDFQCIETD